MTVSFRLVAFVALLSLAIGVRWSWSSATALPQSDAPPSAAVDDDLNVYLTGADVPEDAARRFLQGVRAHKGGDFSAAERAFLGVGRSTPAFSDWAYLLAAEAAAARGDTLAVVAHLSASSAWLAREWGWRSRVRALRAGGEVGRAANVALELAQQLQLVDGQAQARRTAAELILIGGDTARGVLLLREVIQSGADRAALRPAAILLSEASREPADQLQSARVLASTGDVVRATTLLPKVVRAEKLAGTVRAQLRLNLARAHFEARRYTETQRLCSELMADLTEPLAARTQAQVLRARALLRLGQRAQAIAQLEQAMLASAGDVVADAAFLLGDLEGNGDGNAARVLFTRSASSGPLTPAGTESMIRLGASAFARKQYDSALHWFERARGGAPHYQPRATYWSARTRVLLGDTGASTLFRTAIAHDPVSYYALKAAARLGQSNAALGRSPEANHPTEQQVARAFARYDLLRRAELLDLASFEQSRVRRNFNESPPALYALAERLHAAGQTQAAINLGRQLQRQRGKWDERLLRIVYPLPYQDIIRSEAERQKVDPFLAAALIRQESAFNPRATSAAGARGLMQLMPKTGGQIARTAGVLKFRTARLYEPDLNVRLGMQHLKTLLQAHADRLPLVLSAYNAGPHRLTKWLSFPEAVDDELFTERIPFAETRDYVRIVQQNAHIYHLAYGSALPIETAAAH